MLTVDSLQMNVQFYELHLIHLGGQRAPVVKKPPQERHGLATRSSALVT